MSRKVNLLTNDKAIYMAIALAGKYPEMIPLDNMYIRKCTEGNFYEFDNLDLKTLETFLENRPGDYSIIEEIEGKEYLVFSRYKGLISLTA